MRFDYQVVQTQCRRQRPTTAATFPRSCVVQALSHGNDPDTFGIKTAQNVEDGFPVLTGTFVPVVLQFDWSSVTDDRR